MSAHGEHPRSDAHGSGETRLVAGVLREARRRLHAGLDAADACGWAISLAPESRAAQRLAIDWFLCSGQFEQALTLTRTVLRQRGDDWRILLRRARALLAIDRCGEAFGVIDRTLAQRPQHAAALLVAANISARLGDGAGALTLLERADACHPQRADIAQRLVQALLDADRVADASAVLDQMAEADPLLRARTLRAQGRMLDARCLIEESLRDEVDHGRRERLTLELIDVLEASGDWPALRRLEVDADAGPVIAERLARCCIRMGAFDRAEALLALHDRSSARECGVEPAMNAATGNGEDAIACMTSPRLHAHDEHRAQRMQPWLDALMGVVMADQVDARQARRAGADPAMSVLRQLLPAAVATLDRALAHHADDAAVERWSAMRDACEHALNESAPSLSDESAEESLANGLRLAA